jgi:hypothetical protein
MVQARSRLNQMSCKAKGSLREDDRAVLAPFALTFTYATLDLKMNWRQYKESLEKELK